LTCAQARTLLGAYRRDDWPPAELEALGHHLGECAECRRVEAAYRQVGEGIRQLPSITPPAALRAAVFAAIRAEEAQRAGSLAQLTTDDTQPRMPALGSAPRAPVTPLRPLVLGSRTAIAVAAVLLIGLSTARLVPALAQGLPLVAGNLASFAENAVSGVGGPHVDQYATGLRSGRITQAMASAHWVAYTATDASGRSKLYAQSRSATRNVTLLPTPQDAAIAVRGVSDHWVVWLSGGGTPSAAWTLWASPLPGAPGASAAGQPIALASSADTTSSARTALGGVWVGGDVVLVAEMTRAGDAVLARLDLVPGQAAPSAAIVAHAQVPGHLLTDPSAANGTYYWAEVWVDGAAGLRSDIWQSDDASGQVRQVTTDGQSFAPRTTDQSLVWVRPSHPVFLDPAAVASQPAQAVQQALEQLGGSIRTRDLRSGAGQQVIANASASSLGAAGGLVVWRDAGQTHTYHTYDLTRKAPSAVDSQIRAAAYADANGASLTWGQSGSSTIDVYDGR
jgi:hypothetical protein